MPQSVIIIFLLGILVGIGVGLILWKKARKDKRKIKPLIAKQAKEKEENLRRVLELFRSQGQVVNDDVEKALTVSDATATNYLEELERAGKIRQVGDTGRGVYYELIR